MTIVEDVAARFVSRAMEEVGDAYTSMSLQALIDGVADHNQLMLDCIEEVSPCVRRLVHESMLLQDSRQLWVEIVNWCFETAHLMVEVDA